MNYWSSVLSRLFHVYMEAVRPLIINATACANNFAVAIGGRSAKITRLFALYIEERCRSSVVEHFIGNEEVPSSNLGDSTIIPNWFELDSTFNSAHLLI